MKKAMLATLAILALSMTPLTAMAAMHDHGSHSGSSSMGSMDHGAMKDDGHGGMHMDAATVMLPDQTVEGIKAMAHVKDAKAAMAKMGMKETHHLAVAFVGKDGKQITEGTVAVKIEDPAGMVGEPIPLMGMQGHFGADIVLDNKGSYKFKVGSKLPDGVVRQYEFKFEVK